MAPFRTIIRKLGRRFLPVGGAFGLLMLAACPSQPDQAQPPAPAAEAKTLWQQDFQIPSELAGDNPVSIESQAFDQDRIFLNGRLASAEGVLEAALPVRPSLILALDRKTGTMLWSWGGKDERSVVISEGARPAAGRFYALLVADIAPSGQGLENQRIVILDATSGKAVWEEKTRFSPDWELAGRENLVYLADFAAKERTISAVDVAEKKVVWEAPLPEDVTSLSDERLTVRGDTVALAHFSTARAGYAFRVFDAKTGEILWERFTPRDRALGRSRALVDPSFEVDTARDNQATVVTTRFFAPRDGKSASFSERVEVYDENAQMPRLVELKGEPRIGRVGYRNDETHLDLHSLAGERLWSYRLGEGNWALSAQGAQGDRLLLRYEKGQGADLETNLALLDGSSGKPVFGPTDLPDELFITGLAGADEILTLRPTGGNHWQIFLDKISQ